MKSELEAVLASSQLKRAPALAKFLSFICEELFAGRADRLKEYTIAVEAFGRPESFQPKEDPIVRVDAIRLRKCLSDYYRGEGRSHRVQISLPKGHYVPEFQTIESPVDSETARGGSPTRVTPKKMTPAWRRAFITLGILTPLIAASVFLAWRSFSTKPQEGSPVDSAVTAARSVPANPGSVAISAATPPELRILAGNTIPRYIDQLGREWVGDRYFSGGKAEETLFDPIVRAEDRTVWHHYRAGDSFQYDIPLKSGTYELHLFFTEPVFGVDALRGGGETARIFDVSANGKPLLQAFDILGDAGGPRTADIKVFTDITPGPDGFLHLKFAARTAEALVNALELIPGLPGRMQPIRITAHNVPFFSKKQVLWGPDQYYSGGRYHPLELPVTGTDEPELYSTERFGNFSYTIPVASGSYTVVFHFSEPYFGPANYGQGGVSSRVFDVYCNGVVLLKDFDIYKEAGGSSRALRKEIHGLRPNALGKLVFTFQPIRNYPCINAIEVFPE
jgi:Malectin domain